MVWFAVKERYESRERFRKRVAFLLAEAEKIKKTRYAEDLPDKADMADTIDAMAETIKILIKR
jgi:DNA recombination-dependent growth factor C